MTIAFFWRVSQKTMYLKKEHGGAKILDLESYFEGKKDQWIVIIHFSTPQRWNQIGKYYLKTFDTMHNLENFILDRSCLNGLDMGKILEFYKNCLQAWCNLRKVLHRSVYMESRLQKMNRSDGICKIYNLEIESTIHMLFSCTVA